MAKKKNNYNSKKKSTTKKTTTNSKATTKKKVTTTKKNTQPVAKTTTTKKVTSTPKKNTNKKTTTKSTVKKSTPKKSTTKTTPKKQNIKLVDKEVINIKNQEETKIELPKLKENKIKNNNTPQRVIKTEEYHVINKDSDTKKKNSKSNAKRVENAKKNQFLKKFSKVKRKIKMYGINSVIPIKYLVIALIIIVLLIATPFVYNLFFNKDHRIDLSDIPSKIDYLETVSFNIDEASNIVSSSGAYDSLKDYYEYDFKEVFELNSSYVDEYVIKYNKSKKQVFIAIKAVSDHYEDVKNSIEGFLSKNDIKDYEYLEYQGYQFFIKSKNDAVVLSKIKQSKIRVFNILQDLKKDDITELTNITDNYYVEAVVKTAMLRSDTCGYAIFKPANAYSKTKIMNLMEDYYNGLEAKWQNNEENKNLVHNRYFEEYQGYLIYIVSHDNDLAIQLLKN